MLTQNVHSYDGFIWNKSIFRGLTERKGLSGRGVHQDSFLHQSHRSCMFNSAAVNPAESEIMQCSLSLSSTALTSAHHHNNLIINTLSAAEVNQGWTMFVFRYESWTLSEAVIFWYRDAWKTHCMTWKSKKGIVNQSLNQSINFISITRFKNCRVSQCAVQ